MTKIEITIVEQDNGRVVPAVRVVHPLDGQAPRTRREWRVEHVLKNAIPFAEIPPRPKRQAPGTEDSWNEPRCLTHADAEFGSHLRELVDESSPLEWLVAKHLMQIRRPDTLDDPPEGMDPEVD